MRCIISGKLAEMPVNCDSAVDDIEDIVNKEDLTPNERNVPRKRIVPKITKRRKQSANTDEQDVQADSIIPGKNLAGYIDQTQTCVVIAVDLDIKNIVLMIVFLTDHIHVLVDVNGIPCVSLQLRIALMYTI